MRKFKNKGILISSLFICLLIVGIGILVQGEEGNSNNESQDGLSKTEFSCFKESGEEDDYKNITFSTSKNQGGWSVIFYNLPSEAMVKVDDRLFEKPSIEENPTGVWTLTLNFKATTESVSISIAPSYLQKASDHLNSLPPEMQEACKEISIVYNLSQDTVLGAVSTNEERKQQILANLPSGEDTISFSDKGIEKTQAEIDKGISLPACDYRPWVDTNKASYRTKSIIPGKNDYCDYECQEEVTVTYGPPIITAAGMGIEYEVTVNSTFQCNTKQRQDIKWPTPKPACIPTPVCTGGVFNLTGTNWDKAGPEEEFDECVMSCDNGNYSQKCIDSCYQKVYGTNNSLPLTYGKQLDYGLAIDGVTRPNGNLSMNGNGGYYVTGENGDVRWVSTEGAPCGSSNKNGNCAAYYYYATANKSAWTNNLLKNGDSTAGRKRVYWIDPDGFVRGATNGIECNATCKWQGCTGKSGKDYYLSVEEAQKEYDNALDEVENKIKLCKTGKPKVEEYTATYTVTVKNAPQLPKTFEAKNSKYNGSMVVKDKDDSTKLTYNFPTAYLNKKNGAVDYNYRKNPKGYQLGGNKFYTSLLSKNTNTSWYDVKLKYMEDQKTEDVAGFDEKSINYNINSSIKDYGYFNWNFNLDCFYALKRKGNCIEDVDEKCPPDKENEPDYTQFIFRPISLSDVFPNDRNPRWNWSCSATNVNNKSYPINPTSLKANIEATGNKIYDASNEDTYLDYDIYLTKETMKNIREYNAKQKSYSDYSDMVCEKNANGVTQCRSDFLRKTSIFKNGVKKLGVIGCNNQSGTNSCDTLISYTKECQDYFRKK